ncbi:endonuclease/exonuclease/phosphatase family protein [Rhodococcus koreensis]|uniref:endonuclease/exonuclease/phosphatase family protein n=1 Tax=Rhodococcus koreensis TaxID=99653 RepID=UPI00366AB5A9
MENLFSRPRAMSAPPDVATNVLEAHARINQLFEHETYTDADKAEILGHLTTLRLVLDDGDPRRRDTYAVLRRIRGQLLKRPRGGGEDDVIVVAEGRGDWVGWVDLIKDRIDASAITHTAQVFTEIAADIVGVVEAEDRITLARFSDSLIRDNADRPRYPHIMLIDGNDTRGIDVGVLSTDQYPIGGIRSHIDDGPIGNPIFSRDCPEYQFTFPTGSSLAGQPLVILINHLKSKFGGNDSSSSKRRRKQAEAVAQIYKNLRDRGVEHIAVLGDLNDTPDSDPLEPLLHSTDLTDISKMTPFDDGDPDEERPGTFGNGTKSDKIDYLLLSPSLFGRTTGGGIFRKGVWGGKNGTLFPHFDTITSKANAASDHAALYADIDIS